MGICKCWERQIPRGVGVGVCAWLPVPGGGGAACIASPLGACPECFVHASAEDQPPSEANVAAALAPAPVQGRASGMIQILLKPLI